MRRGALDFELPEVKIVLDKETGAPVGVEKRSEDPGVKKAYQLIEELMLLANELVARHLAEKAVPAIYRVHGPPDEKKLDRFASMATTLGVAFDLEDAKDPKRLTALLKRVANLPGRDVFNMLLLRAMKQATYDTANIGHFGLASTTYLHFTSPIRRYPDLVVHRAVRELLNQRPADKSATALESLKLSATMASERERHAMDVEREVVDLYRALYMRAYIGATFTGKVTALVGSGVFVQLDSPFVDVLVRSESLGSDRYELDDEGMRMVGLHSGDVISLGDKMEVVIEDVAILRRSIYGRRVGAAVALERPRGIGKRDKKGRRMEMGRGGAGRGDQARGAQGRGRDERRGPGPEAPRGQSRDERRGPGPEAPRGQSRDERRGPGPEAPRGRSRDERRGPGPEAPRGQSRAERRGQGRVEQGPKRQEAKAGSGARGPQAKSAAPSKGIDAHAASGRKGKKGKKAKPGVQTAKSAAQGRAATRIKTHRAGASGGKKQGGKATKKGTRR
jgi:ribonuclease R